LLQRRVVVPARRRWLLGRLGRKVARNGCRDAWNGKLLGRMAILAVVRRSGVVVLAPRRADVPRASRVVRPHRSQRRFVGVILVRNCICVM
jgi:hypothetical protein